MASSVDDLAQVAKRQICAERLREYKVALNKLLINPEATYDNPFGQVAEFDGAVEVLLHWAEDTIKRQVDREVTARFLKLLKGENNG